MSPTEPRPLIQESSRRVHRVNVNFTASAYALLQDLAERQGKTISDVLRDALALEHWFDSERRDGSRILTERNGSVREVIPR